MNEPARKIVTLDDLERRSVGAHVKPYYDWIRHIVSLSIGSLTALIALQGSYLPSHPQLPVFLAICWVALLATILLGILALRAEYNTHLESARNLRALRVAHGDAYAANQVMKNGGTLPHWSHKWTVRLMVAFFILSLVSLCVFAVVNLLAKNA
jgi:hypothetical protein